MVGHTNSSRGNRGCGYRDSRDSGGVVCEPLPPLSESKGKAITPAPARLVAMEAMGDQESELGEYISAVLR